MSSNEIASVMRQALEALNYLQGIVDTERGPKAAEALRQAIARAEHLEAEKQEAVAMQMDVIVVNLVREGINKHRARELAEHFIKHTHPQPKRAVSETHKWVGLTDEEYLEAESVVWVTINLDSDEKEANQEFYKAIEAKLKAKNFA